jgi:hypothetical protein
VEVCPWNLFTNSQTFSTGGWSFAGTIADNVTISPDGTQNAGQMSNSPYIYQTGSYGICTMSCYLKKSTGNAVLFRMDTTIQNYIEFNVNTGVVGTVASGFTASMQSVGNGWYRCIASSSLPISIAFVIDACYMWGAQINNGALAPYFPTTDRLNVPRLTYQNGGGGCPSLLLEKQSTNQYPYSEDLTQWTTSGSPTVTGNDSTSPDGTTNADRVQFNASGNLVYNSGTGSAGTNVLTVYAKAKSGTAQKFRFFANGATTISNDFTATDQWQRFEFIYTYSALTAGLQGASTGASDVLFWGFQHEASSYPTSYIPTTSASATRVADACFRNSYAGGITSEGTIFADFEYLRTDGGYATPCLIINGSNYIYMFVISNTIRANCTNGGVIQSQIISSTVTPNTRYKVAATFKTNDFSLYVNGALIGTDTSGTMPTFSTSFNTYVGTDSSLTEPVGKLNELVIFPVGLTNSELASLTTI